MNKCISCHDEEDCNFIFRCSRNCSACCKDCLKRFLKNNVKQIFQSKNQNCPYCFEEISEVCLFSDEEGFGTEMVISDFGIKSAKKDDDDDEVYREDIYYALSHYSFQIIVENNFLPTLAFQNTMKFFHGLKNMILFSKKALKNETVMKDVTIAEKRNIVIAMMRLLLRLQESYENEVKRRKI